MKKIKVVSLILLAVSAVITADLLLNFLASTVPTMNDGINCRSVLVSLLTEDWSVESFYNYFATSLWINVAIFIENIILSIILNYKR